jgi:hypothetical protein
MQHSVTVRADNSQLAEFGMPNSRYFRHWACVVALGEPFAEWPVRYRKVEPTDLTRQLTTFFQHMSLLALHQCPVSLETTV